MFLSPVFFQRLSIFSAGLFFKDFFTCQSFFSKTLHLFSNLSFSQRLFSQLSVFFKASFLAKDRQSNTGRTTRKVLVGQPVLLSLSIAKVYLRVPCSLSFFKDNLFFLRASLSASLFFFSKSICLFHKDSPWAPPFLQRLAFLLQLHPISYQEEVKHECIFCSKLHSDPLPFCAKMKLNGTSGSFAGSNVQLVAPDSIQKEIFAKKEAKKSWKCNLCSKCQEIPGICCRGCTCINPIELASALIFFCIVEPTLHGWCAMFWISNHFFQRIPFPTIPMKKVSFLTLFSKGFHLLFKL